MANPTIRSMFCLLMLSAGLSAFAVQSPGDVEQAGQHIAALARKVIGEHQRAVLIHMPAGSNEKSGSKQLAGMLNDITHPRGVVLVIGSEDISAMASIIKNGFATVRRHRLAGCVVVYVGSASERRSVGEVIAKSGAEFRFVEFQP